jgi:hypothetical protein
MAAKIKTIFENHFVDWEYNHPKNRTNDAPTEVVISNVDCTNISLRIIIKILLTLLTAIIDVAEIRLLNVHVDIVSKKPRTQENKIGLIDLISRKDMKSKHDDNAVNSPMTNARRRSTGKEIKLL